MMRSGIAYSIRLRMVRWRSSPYFGNILDHRKTAGHIAVQRQPLTTISDLLPVVNTSEPDLLSCPHLQDRAATRLQILLIGVGRQAGVSPPRASWRRLSGARLRADHDWRFSARESLREAHALRERDLEARLRVPIRARGGCSWRSRRRLRFPAPARRFNRLGST